MDQAQQDHRGSEDNVGRDKHVHYHSGRETRPRSKYLNTFAHYDLANLVGRAPQLRAIDEHLSQRKLLLLHGIGGIGKTTLARAYISQAQDQYDHIAYVEIVGSIAESLLNQLGNSADVGLEVDAALDPETKFEALIDTLRRIPKLLLVLDNANDAEDLRVRKKQLASLNATVLITGRARPQSFVQERAIQEVQALTPDEALRLFRTHYTSDLTAAKSRLIESMLEDAFYHPKLIEVIAKAAQSNAFLELDELQQIVGKKDYDDEEINYPIEIDDQTRKIYRVLLDLFDTELLSEDAQQLLRYFAILPTADIPVQDLAILLQVESTEDRQALIGHLNSLVHGGWLEELNNRFFSMHGLVQWVVRQRLKPTALNCEVLIHGMATALAYKPTESPLDKQRYLPYTVDWLALFTDDEDDGLANTFSWIALIYGALGNHQQALSYNQKALIIREAVLPPTHPDLAGSYNNLAVTYYYLADLGQAHGYMQKAVMIREHILPPDHTDLISSRRSLVYIEQEQLKQNHNAE
ncbi:tetratricopeptide repeat protein [Nostoc sp. CHAB 5834]|nr:tetratricopeptide repeat protein [Nostoc sp. CHAB 5834]